MKMKKSMGLKTIVSYAVGITIISLSITGCNNKMLSSTQKPVSDSAQKTLSQLAPTNNSQLISPTSIGSQPGKTASNSASAKSTTKADLSKELKAYLKTNYGSASHEKPWYKYISRITVDGKNVTITTSLHSDKQVATSIASAVLDWPKFSGVVTVEGSNGTTLAKESKAQ